MAFPLSVFCTLQQKIDGAKVATPVGCSVALSASALPNCHPERSGEAWAQSKDLKCPWVLARSFPIGRLDAVHRTFLFGFADDITVRLKPRAQGTRIDVRSVSRIGRHDFGTNAGRIVRFLEEVYAQATTR